MVNNKMKIVRAATVSMSCIFFEEIMRRMRGLGYEMFALTSPGPELERLKAEGFAVIGVEMERRISIRKDVRSLNQLIKVFHAEKPDMVHSMTPKAGLLCMVAAKVAHVPVRVHTFTGLVWPTSSGLKRKILMATDWLTCACATHIIPEGRGVLDDLKNGGITRKPMKVLGFGNVMGIDLDRFNPMRFSDIQKDSDTFTFLFVGRLVGDKGINELVEAFAHLHGKYSNTRLKLVGKYEDKIDPLKPDTLRMINSNSAIDDCGPKYGDDLLLEYLKADCFIMPSYREGFPNTVIEAGAMGLPSIVTDINGSREIVIDGENGIIVPPCSSQPLYEAMERVLVDVDFRETMCRNARPSISSRFEKGFVQKCLLDYYEEILS